MRFLTKSLYMSGQQCPRLLWFSSRNQLPEPSLYDKHKFAQGRDFEKYVKKLFPDGMDLGNLNHGENIKETQNLIHQSKTIFEACMVYKNLFFKGDILEPSAEGWNLYEMKASTKVKDEHIPDLAEPFKNYDYYNPIQKGRYSLKAVLPAITGKDYSDLEINNGTDASMKYFYSHIKADLKNVDEIRNNLLKYCGLDTEGMIWIIEELNRIVS